MFFKKPEIYDYKESYNLRKQDSIIKQKYEKSSISLFESKLYTKLNEEVRDYLFPYDMKENNILHSKHYFPNMENKNESATQKQMQYLNSLSSNAYDYEVTKNKASALIQFYKFMENK